MFYFINVVEGTMTPIGAKAMNPPEGSDVVLIEVEGVMTEKARAQIIASTQIRVRGGSKDTPAENDNKVEVMREAVLKAWRQYRDTSKGTMAQWEAEGGAATQVTSALVRGAAVARDLLDSAYERTNSFQLG